MSFLLYFDHVVVVVVFIVFLVDVTRAWALMFTCILLHDSC